MKKNTNDLSDVFLGSQSIPNLWLKTILHRHSTISDAGSVKVGSDSFSVLIPTGDGDGESAYCVYTQEELDADKINTADLNYFTLLSGQFSVYDYDCGDTVSATLEGRFNVYYAEGIVFFVKVD